MKVRKSSNQLVSEKEVDQRCGGWYRVPSTVIDEDDEHLIYQWLRPFYETRFIAPRFYKKLLFRLLERDYDLLVSYIEKETEERHRQNSSLDK